jgi:hypothetical protein
MLGSRPDLDQTFGRF